MTTTLGDALSKEMKRVRDELLPIYDAVPTGIFAATLMRLELDHAVTAMMNGDIVEMIKTYQALKEFEL